jgi:hypothetical protein
LGAGGTSFFVNPQEALFAIFMSEANDLTKAGYYARLLRSLVMQAIVD